ncbi:MAG: hypothetical protein N2510_06095 [Ignavibacteria bacterium]|nr:hypothetical protein [Ignavibacteria bacterium]
MSITERFRRSFLFSAVISVYFVIYLQGCVNVDQKTTIAKDGSGSMTVHYWTKMSNVSSGTELGSFSFDKDKAKSNYSSSNNEVTNVEVKDKLEDSTKHVTVELKFKNINDITSAKAFEKVKVSWKEGKEGMDFSYTLLKDTVNANNMGSGDTKLTYTFEFPDEVLQTNGRKDGKSVKWEKTLADLKQDVEMTATVKSEGKKCGLFGAEFFILTFTGIVFLALRIRRK